MPDLLHICAPCSEFPSNISTMVGLDSDPLKKYGSKNGGAKIVGSGSLNKYLPELYLLFIYQLLNICFISDIKRALC